MKTGNLLITASILCAALGTTPVFAQNADDPQSSPPAADAETTTPGQPFMRPADDVSYGKDMREDQRLAGSAPVDNGQVQYISGGVADSGMQAIDAEENHYNLKMLFAAQGAYLADVHVAVTDSKGSNVLTATTEGPVLLARMAPGRYTVTATAPDGTSLTRHIGLSRDHLSSYVLHYPSGADTH